MSLQDLSLPIDIPWKVLATSADMLATSSLVFPNAMWRSSVAVFAYDPDLSDLPQEFSDRELTFLKVVTSITSYAPPIVDPSLLANTPGFVDPDKILATSYPCSGALLQVAIYPRGGPRDGAGPVGPLPPVDVSQLAYFTAIEPQKRELIEVVTESGEAMTQSKSSVNVRKGITSTDSTENLDVFTGANLEVGFATAKVAGGVSGQWGTIHKSSTETVDQTTTDTSRDRRETQSHTTNLSQLYHLLNGYHLGTNRAIFFLQSRPHTVQQKDRFTFIQGPQEIEGMQEFFLVVSRPKGMPLSQYCVDALLYTAHLDPDVARRALLEPKTAESPWIDLWATSRVMARSEGPAYRGVATDVGAGVVELQDPVHAERIRLQAENTWTDWAQQFDASYVTEAGASGDGKIVNYLGGWPNPADRKIGTNYPAVLDQVITTGILSPVPGLFGIPLPIPGWRVDRSRGLGGYDLWEDPYNSSAAPINPNGQKFKPQAFIDILSSGYLNSPAAYLPDCAVRIRAFAWAQGSDAEAMYHARIKVYFVRDDAPTDEYAIPMLVTARGVSTCPDSPVANFYSDPSIVAFDESIRPAHIAPQVALTSTSPSAAAATAAGETLGSTNPSAAPPGNPNPPANSARPQGFDPFVTGAARAKMANSMADAVKVTLKLALRSQPKPPIKFMHTDLFFSKMLTKLASLEIAKLIPVLSSGSGADLAAHALGHPSLTTLGGSSAALRLALRAQPTPPTEAVKAPAPSKDFPLLTLASLSAADRQTLAAAGVNSGLDLIGISATQLAARASVDESTARAIRLRALGVITP